jgi:hypothetical protein
VTLGSGTATYNSSVPSALNSFSAQSLRLTQSNNGTNAAALNRVVTTGNLSMTNGSWTFATWFNRATSTNDNFIFYAGNSDGFGGGGDELQLFCPVHSNTVALSHWNTNNVQDIALESANTAATNQWHHVAIVFQHVADGTNNVTLYLDGSSAGTASNIVWVLNQNYPLVFGGHASTTSKTYRWFNGSFDDVALFRGALSQNEIARLATRTVSHFGGWTVTNSVLMNIVAPSNTSPTLAAVSNQVINAGITLTITNIASDSDQPPQTLTFSLAAGPTNASIASSTGVLTWRPVVAQANTTNAFSVVVTDNGSPPLSATQTFTVTVLPVNRPLLLLPAVTNNGLDMQVSGDFGLDYTIQGSTNLVVWTNLFSSNSPALPFSWTDTNASTLPQRFYRVLLGP